MSLGLEPEFSGSAVKRLLINNVNKSHDPYFLITCCLQPCIQAMGDERSIYYKSMPTPNSHKFFQKINCNLN